MTAPAILVENVGKRYARGRGYGVESSLSVKLDAVFRAPFRLLTGASKEPVSHASREEFWALRHVSLEVPKGEALGMIGANGAGKSTLLKLLARITSPTEGRITLRGQVGSLLEVGTGFHPDLTGRDNVFLNGAILGMRRREIAQRFDEIVEFSGVEAFIDTPVKRYSSGMYVRLAFAVAAHLQPEILLVDEVLAVGDADFQRKCMGKMQEARDEFGTTIIFVSHNLAWVRRLCDRAIYVDGGEVQMDGPATQVVDDYLEAVEPVITGGEVEIPPAARRSGTGGIKLTHAAMRSEEGEPIDRVRFAQPFTLSLSFDVEEPIPDGIVVIGVSSIDGTRVLTSFSTEHGRPELTLEPGALELTARINVALVPGEYVVSASITNADGGAYDEVERVLAFTALSIPERGSDHQFPWNSGLGSVVPECDWTIAATSGEQRPEPAAASSQHTSG